MSRNIDKKELIMKTLRQLNAEISALTCEQTFKPYLERESQVTLLQVRKPAEILNGKLTGTEIDVYDTGTFRIWTPQVRKAKTFSSLHSIKVRVLDGECELFVPVHLAGKILKAFGAKTKKSISPAARQRLRAIGFKNRTENRLSGAFSASLDT